MNDHSISYEFNLSYGTPRDDRLLIAREFDTWPVSDQECLVRSCDGGESSILKQDVVVALGLCDRFRSLDDHVARIVERLPHLQAHRDNVRQVLSRLVDQDFLVTADRVRRTLGQSVGEDILTAAPIESLYIRTCGRRRALPRLLDTLATDPYRLKRYIVLDDSPDPETREFVEQLVAERRTATGLPLIYFGLKERHQLTAWLANRLRFDLEILGWLWLPDIEDTEPGYGVGLNLALALAAGRRFALIDDDAVPLVHAAPVQTSGVAFSSREVSVRCYRDRDQLRQGLQSLTLDPIQSHAQHLGKRIGRFVGESPSTTRLFKEIERTDLFKIKPDSRVKITVNGLYGDPGTFGMGWVFHADSDSHAALVADESTYDMRLGNRQVWKGRNALTLSPAHTCALMTTTLTGIDNTELLLPTLPYGRGEDAFLGGLIGVLYPDSVQLELPWALLHQPEDARQWDSTLLDQPEQLPANLYLADRLYRSASGTLADKPEAKAASICADLHDLASSGDALRTDLECSTLGKRGFVIQSLNDRLRQHSDAPEFWRRDVLRMIKANAGLRDDDRVEIGNRLGMVRYRAGRLAAALEIWPAVWALCRSTGEEALLDAATTDNRP